MQTELAPPSGGLSSWIEWGIGELAFLGESEARAECEEILKTLFKVSRPELYLTAQPDATAFSQWVKWVQERKRRIPLAYLLGKAPFWEDEFEVERGVFIPRPETEILIEAFLDRSGFSPSDPFDFLDLGTGSGNIGVTIAKVFGRSLGIVSDLSGKALAIAARNAGRLGVSRRLEQVQGDGLAFFEKGSFDVIFSNPPYVARDEWGGLEPEVRREPRLAFVAGEEGLDFYRKIFRELPCLREGGSLWVEIGWGQAPKVRELFEKASFKTIEVFKDLNQIDRVIGGIGFRG